jgi:hypothetical protein
MEGQWLDEIAWFDQGSGQASRQVMNRERLQRKKELRGERRDLLRKLDALRRRTLLDRRG